MGNSAIVILLLTLVSCSIESIDDSGKIASDYASFTFVADDNLNEDYKSAISEALSEWNIKTKGLVKYSITYRDMSIETTDPISFKNKYKLIIKDPGSGMLGWTSWIANKNSALILIKPDLGLRKFKITLLHELGHAFDIHFGNNIHYTGDHKSIMYSELMNSSDTLECPDLKAFCNKYNCNAECIEISKLVKF